ncbi:HU family DNA-binding protein [Lutimaribacter saemankumensis]|uniref:HU family DNA-binding protein n=1 Tax=Lutimaribacter saemankumensis TaxID=490829 RepID=UPI001FDED2F8|nr:HU family DNA-binding protein [Lutimaribacter saemankumensis]
MTTTTPALTAPEMKKKELIDVVVKRSGIKKKDAKPVVEAMLAVLGEELARGREMNVKPLGKVKINRIKQLPNGRVVMCKLRQNDAPATPAKDPLADAAE